MSVDVRPLPSRLLGRGNGLDLPPKRLRFMNETDERFLELGDHLVEVLTAHVGLPPDSRVLDIGSGYGRLAHALKRHDFGGSYLGIDVLKRHVRWCAKRLSGDGFEFRHVDLRNDRYNPWGNLAVRDLDLGAERFDVIALFSVFTHMWPADVKAYFRLMARVLAPGGRAAATFFLLDHEWHRLVAKGKVGLQMPFEREDGCRYEAAEDPLHRVGYEARWVMLEAIEAGLAPAAPLVYGTWASRPVDRDDHAPAPYQDLVIFQRLADVEQASEQSG